MRIVAKIDSEGYFIEDVVLSENESIPTGCIEERPDTSSKPLYKPRWSGEEWVEGLSQQEIDELESKQPTPTKQEELEQRLDDLEYYILKQEGLI